MQALRNRIDPPVKAILTAAFVLGVIPAANAQIYKCQDAAGKITYQQSPCANAAKSGTLQTGRATASRNESPARP